MFLRNFELAETFQFVAKPKRVRNKINNYDPNPSTGSLSGWFKNL